MLFFRGDSRPDVVAVPDLRDLGSDEARRLVERAGLELEVGDSLPHPEAPHGVVLAQSPLPGGEVAPGTSVRIIVSSGSPRRTVPDVMALTRVPAERLLDASGFRVQVAEVPDPLPAGRVVSLHPAPGTLVQLPAVVQMEVSAGPAMVEVPSLFGLGEDEARSALSAARLRLGRVEYDLGAFGSREMVVDQDPAAGDSIPMGEAVRVRILTNRSYDEARDD